MASSSSTTGSMSTAQDLGTSFTGNFLSDSSKNDLYNNRAYQDQETNQLLVLENNPAPNDDSMGLLAWLFDDETVTEETDDSRAQYCTQDDHYSGQSPASGVAPAAPQPDNTTDGQCGKLDMSTLLLILLVLLSRKVALLWMRCR